jgi:tRNA pseudouridine38-40 synthase
MRFRATVEYDGTEFAGFQAQPAARTVQGELEAALARLSGGIRQPVTGAGRTDAGVHATGQVIAFTYPGTLSAAALMEALNGMLPPDVAISGLRRAPAGFNPRYAARYREYRYTIWNGPRSPLRERTSLWVRSELDITAMAEAATAFEGRHDFSPFGGADPQPVRTVHRLRVRRQGYVVTIDVRADAFLRGMVRRIVAALLAVGRGQLEASAVPGLLTAGRPALDGAAVPAQGLCLRRVVLGRRSGETGNGLATGHED